MFVIQKQFMSNVDKKPIRYKPTTGRKKKEKFMWKGKVKRRLDDVLTTSSSHQTYLHL